MSKGYFDIHCHYLYGVDDGSKSPEMTLRMLDDAYNQGVRNVILTPHYNPKAFKMGPRDLKERYEEFRELVKREGHPDMKFWLGSEIFYHKGTTPEEMREGHVISMAKSRYILLEFHTNVEFSYIETAVGEAQGAGYIPILAHIERFDALRGNLEKVSLIKDGVKMTSLDTFTVPHFEWASVDYSEDDIEANDEFIKKKIKKYKRLQIVIKNDGMFEPFGIIGITKTYTYGNFSK